MSREDRAAARLDDAAAVAGEHGKEMLAMLLRNEASDTRVGIIAIRGQGMEGAAYDEAAKIIDKVWLEMGYIGRPTAQSTRQGDLVE